MNLVSDVSPKSFQVQHWMEQHGIQTKPPRFKFNILSSFKDPLTRQLFEAININAVGNLNRKSEFKSNNLCRLVCSQSEFDRERENIKSRSENSNFDSNIASFVMVMSDVKNVKLLELMVDVILFSDTERKKE